MDTKQKILDTAERLFAERGYSATSLRHIIGEAEVNLAAIHYHFGSKEELLGQIVLRKAGPVNEDRMAKLEGCEREAGAGPLEVEKVLEAFLLPMAEAADRNPGFVQMMGRLTGEGLLPEILAQHFRPVTERLESALRRALPDLPPVELQWRMHFMIGALAHTMCGARDFTGIGGHGDFRSRIERLAAFLGGASRAVSQTGKNEEQK